MRTFVLLVAMIVGVSSIFVYLSIHGSMHDETDETRLVPSLYYMPIPGQEVSLDNAQASAPFKIRLPTSAGSFAQLKQFIVPEENMSAVYIIYAVDKLPSNASIPEVLDHNGIILFEVSTSAYAGTLQNAEGNLRAAINDTKDYPNGGNLQPVTINGYFGCAGGNVGNCVMWATETTYYQLMANKNYPLQRLVAMAQSIPVS